jgi:hypothetical protein
MSKVKNFTIGKVMEESTLKGGPTLAGLEEYVGDNKKKFGKLTVNIDRPTYKKLREKAGRLDKSMTTIIRELVEAYVKP